MTGTIAVIGAGGATGAPLLTALHARGLRIRAISRRAGEAGLFPTFVEPRGGDLTDVVSLAAAVSGATSIHYIPPSFDPREEAYARNLIEAAGHAGVARLVYHSVLHPMTPEMPHHRRKAQVELLLRRSALDWTILQPAMYAQTALAFFDRKGSRLMPAFDPAQPFTPVHEGDLAEASALVHSDPGHTHATYELAGPERLTFDEMGERLAALLGRPVSTGRVPADELAAKVAAARGYTADQVRELGLMFTHYDAHGLVGNGTVLRLLLDREPADFTQAMRESLGL